MLPVESPFKTYTGLDGKPLHNGYVYFGQPNQNPLTAPVTVYWDAAGTQPAAQPLRTTNGYIMRAGTPANVFINDAYSELVRDSKGAQIFYARTSDSFSIAGQVLQLFTSIGSSLIGFIQAGVGAVQGTIQDQLRETLYAENYDTLAHAITAAAGKHLVLNHTYAVDNSVADGLVIAVDNIRISGEGTINFSSIVNNGIKITGKGVTIEGITVKGPGTYDTSATGGAVVPGLIYIDGTGLTEPINCRIHKVKVLEPGKMGIVAYKAVGFDITDCRVENSRPVATWLNTSNNHLIRIYSCANYKVQDNQLRGFSEGIVVQAYPATDYNFDDFSGTIGNKTRKGILSGNVVLGTYDHCIYFSNDNEHYVCSNNFLWMASVAEGGEGTCSLKLEGGYFEACGNYSREGIQMRNPYYGRVENNMVPIYSGRGTASNPSKFGILSQDTIYQRDTIGMSICNNTIVVMGGVEVDAGIWIQGAVWAGYQSRIINLSICNNNIYGVGKSTTGEGYGIGVHQDMPIVAGVVTGSTGSGVTISGNTIDMSTFTGYGAGLGSYGIELLNIDFATVTGNTARNFSLRGVNALGMRYSMVGNNTLIGNAASASQKFATFENASTPALHVDSVSNTYGINHAENVAIKYFPAHQSTVCADLLPLVNAGAVNFNQTISSYDVAQVFLWAPTAGALTLTLSVGRPWCVGQKLDVVNKGSQPFTVTNTGTVVAIDTKVTFCCTGSNTFITYV